MTLSIILINYNTCDLLRQCLYSLLEAGKDVDNEIFVIDNASSDKSVEMLKFFFPTVNLIENKAHEDIAPAYNKTIARAKGEYVLLINPDTICGKKTLEKIIGFMDFHTDAGGLGVRMITPEGRFLSESKHGLSKQWAAFLKISGLLRYFPKSDLTKKANRDWIEEFQTSETDTLNGAFMLLRRSVLNETGLFDERFKHYGYDTDLSYRIRLAGYKNFYFPKTFIINYNSLQLPKFSWSYLKYFYGAMFIFAAKYLFKGPDLQVKGLPQLFPSSYEVER